jgi:hypothetical protein
MFGGMLALVTPVAFVPQCEAPCWRTVPSGIYKSPEAMRHALAVGPKRIAVGDGADALIGRLTFWQFRRENRLVRLSGADLGLRGPTEVTLFEVYKRAGDLEYNFCQVETGPMLRLDYLDQPVGEYLHIPVYHNQYDGTASSFNVGNDGTSYLLFGGDGTNGTLVPAHAMKFVFCLN